MQEQTATVEINEQKDSLEKVFRLKKMLIRSRFEKTALIILLIIKGKKIVTHKKK